MGTGAMGEFEVEIENDGLFEHGFTPVSQSGTVQIEGALVSVSPLVVSLEGLPIEITVPSGITLPALTPGEEIELTVQPGADNTFTLVSIDEGEALQRDDDGGSGGGGDDGGGDGGGGH